MPVNINIIEKITRIFKELFPELSGDIDLNETQDKYKDWDSFSHMQLVSRIEDEFGITLEIEEVIELDSAMKFAEIVEKKL
jgi:acyl carrier protein